MLKTDGFPSHFMQTLDWKNCRNVQKNSYNFGVLKIFWNMRLLSGTIADLRFDSRSLDSLKPFVNFHIFLVAPLRVMLSGK